MKKYLLTQLAQVSAWIGFLLIVAAFIAPRWVILLFGIILVATDDDKMKSWVAKNAPGFTKWLDEITK